MSKLTLCISYSVQVFIVLIKCIFQGVIRDSRDLEMLGPEFKDAYSNRPDIFQ